MTLPAPVPPAAAFDEDTGRHSHAALLDGIRKALHHLLGHLELRPAVGAHLFFGGQGLGDTDAGDLFGFRFRQVLIGFVRAHFVADPLQDEVGGWDGGHLSGV